MTIMNFIEKYKTILIHNIFLYLLVMVVAFCLKLHYSRATSDDLVWILKPTSVLVEHVTGIGFKSVEDAGFVSQEHRIIIAPSCAGVNFLIMAFCMSAFSSLHQPGLRRIKLLRIAACGAASYLITLVVNTIRIKAAIYLYKYSVAWGLFTSDRIHRIEGIVVYFLFLFIYYHGIQKIMNLKKKEDKNSLNISSWYRSGLTPWFWYLLITLGVPLLNAAYLNNFSRFLEHSTMVVLVSMFVLALILVTKILSHLNRY